jgi:hypothetical protein
MTGEGYEALDRVGGRQTGRFDADAFCTQAARGSE